MPVLARDVLERVAADADACVGDEHVDVACLLGQSNRGLRVAQIGPDLSCAQIRRRRGLVVGDDDLVAVIGKGTRDRGPDAATRAGDEGYLDFVTRWRSITKISVSFGAIAGGWPCGP